MCKYVVANWNEEAELVKDGPGFYISRCESIKIKPIQKDDFDAGLLGHDTADASEMD